MIDTVRSSGIDDPYQTPITDPSRPGLEPPYSKPTLLQMLFSFSGRVPRRIYWGVTLLVTVVMYAMMFGIFGIDEEKEPSTIGLLIFLALLVPFFWISLAIGVKRWHDRDKSGWMTLVGMIPLVGPIWTLVERGCSRGTVGPNQYGPDPT
ncbi:DUF805 domain-containing protein [Akkermansiaceae bacterium]|nr:DUF805 domain-containing protein [Akkermansiaceae bacterium]MDB4804499.1 DUF805 domain-containing protein [Akkermansiaceae bacterium]MDC1206945.1 DUF805 domain-containing protein [Akkermansiaceae bacterium]